MAQWIDGNWKPLADAPPFANPHVRLAAATVDGKGNIWATHSSGVAMYDGKKWTDFKESLNSPNSVAVDANGDVWIAAYDGLRVLSNGAWKKPTIAGLAPPLRLREIRADTRGRLWATTSWGLAVIENGGARFQRIANSDIPGDDLRGLLVSGAGPKSLTVIADKPLGSLKGKIEGPDNTGLSGARVEICNARLSSMTSFKRNETPCTNQAPLSYDTKTGKDGSFLFEKVPPGEYSLVVEGGSGKWVLLTGSFTGGGAERIRVGAGKPTSVPTVTLKAKP